MVASTAIATASPILNCFTVGSPFRTKLDVVGGSSRKTGGRSRCSAVPQPPTRAFPTLLPAAALISSKPDDSTGFAPTARIEAQICRHHPATTTSRAQVLERRVVITAFPRLWRVPHFQNLPGCPDTLQAPISNPRHGAPAIGLPRSCRTGPRLVAHYIACFRAGLVATPGVTGVGRRRSRHSSRDPHPRPGPPTVALAPGIGFQAARPRRTRRGK
jgi:hypothetical protein